MTSEDELAGKRSTMHPQPELDSSPNATAADAAAGVAASMEQVTGFVGQFAQAARAEACIGPAHSEKGHTVLPIASVSVQAGFGLGFGGGGGGEGAAQGQGSGGGGGGGGRGASRVVALVDISETGVSVRPVPDVTTLILAMIALAGLALVTRGGRNGIGRRLLPFLRSAQP
jgi:uncharacterized spore protein YtfJ